MSAASAPDPVRPMLPTAGPVPAGADWAFEFAWDGIRAIAHVEAEAVRLVGGNERSIGAHYPELAVLAERAAGRRLVLDGKVVALDGFGRPDFARLRRRMNRDRPSDSALRSVPVGYYLLDLLRVDDRVLLDLPYRQRRALLAELGLAGGPIVLPPVFLDTDGRDVLRTAGEYGLPGVLARHADSTYHPGRRSRNWVATALRRSQQVLIGGWLPGNRAHQDTVGSLLVGVPTEVGPRFVARVGTGLSSADRAELRMRLAEVGRRTSPFAGEFTEAGQRVRWVEPVLFGEVAYRSWTRHGRLTYPTWQGLRPDVHPAAVHSPLLLPAPRQAPDDAVAGLAEQLRAARAEVELLRTQFSAHFLSNALNTMVSLVRTDPARARSLLADFAHFARYSLGPLQARPLGEELENVQRYLRIESARLGQRLRHEITVSPKLLAVPVPALAVQLLVMTAVRHGIERRRGGGELRLRAAAQQAQCVCTLQESGSADTTGHPAVLDNLGPVRERLRDWPDARLVVHAAPDTDPRCELRFPLVGPTGR